MFQEAEEIMRITFIVSHEDVGKSRSISTTTNKIEGYKKINLLMLYVQARGSRDLPLATKTNRAPDMREAIDDVVHSIGTGNSQSGATLSELTTNKQEVDENSVPQGQV